jgi:hypothetical protein
MQIRSFVKVLGVAALAMLLAAPGVSYAQGDARFAGHGSRSERRVRARRDGDREESEEPARCGR